MIITIDSDQLSQGRWTCVEKALGNEPSLWILKKQNTDDTGDSELCLEVWRGWPCSEWLAWNHRIWASRKRKAADGACKEGDSIYGSRM